MSLMIMGAAAWRRSGDAPPVSSLYWNPADKAPNASLSDENKVVGGPLGGPKYVRTVTSKSSGKWRVQFVALSNVTNGASAYGFARAGDLGVFLGGNENGFALWGNYSNRTRVYHNNSFIEYSSGGVPGGGVIDILLDIDLGMAWWALEGSVISGDPVAGTGPMATFTPSAEVFIAADPFVMGQSTRLRTHPSEIVGPSFSGFTNGWPV